MLAILDPRSEGPVKYSTSVFRFVCFISEMLVEIFDFLCLTLWCHVALKKFPKWVQMRVFNFFKKEALGRHLVHLLPL